MSASTEKAAIPAVPAEDQKRLTAARISATIVMFTFSAAVASYIARIPAMKDDLGLDEGTLGLALIGAPIGIVLSVTNANRFIIRFGSRAVCRFTVTVGSACLALPAIAWNVFSLSAGLFVMGAVLGLTDVSTNAQGVSIEKKLGRPIMNSLHGAYSVGGLTGAGLGWLMAHQDVDFMWHLLAVAAAMAVLGFFGSMNLLPSSEVDQHEPDAPKDGEEKAESNGKRPKAALITVATLAAVALCSFAAEGSIGDWSGVYLQDNLDASDSTAVLGFLGLSIAMAIGRLLGDKVVEKIGGVAAVRAGALLAAAAMALAILAPNPAVAILGFTIAGFGFAPIVPVAFSAAGSVQGVAPSWAIAKVSGVAYIGMLGGPPIIGFIAHQTSLTVALAVPAVLIAIVAIVANVVKPAEKVS